MAQIQLYVHGDGVHRARPEMATLIYGRDIRHVLLLRIGAFDAVMLPRLLHFIKSEGFRFVTLGEAEFLCPVSA
jgi:hypothetical protein